MKNNYFKEKNYIHYSNCHEDFLLLKRYIPAHAKKILSIASALDNSLAFLENDEVEVLAVDSNLSQVYLSNLKITAIRLLSYKEFLIFLGFQAGDSVKLYGTIKDHLDPHTREYFDSRPFLIKNKLIHAGRFEHYFHLFKRRILPLVASKKRIQQFMSCTSLEEQVKQYKKYINNFRFKILFHVFFSKKVMSKLGRDKSFFTYSKGALANQLKERVELGLMSNLNCTNPYLQYAMLNQYKELPYYAKEDVFYKIKRNISHITVAHQSFEEALLEHKEFDFMNLSDIFEYMPEDISGYEELIKKACNPYAKICFWNMMNLREFKGMKRINTKEDLKRDKAMYYQDFLVYEV
ncbi:MAG: BtaA family protein [Anaeroplasmataceae bacterium]|nr:BtaA family protein [Anaeroplasmataceae bacterium]